MVSQDFIRKHLLERSTLSKILSPLSFVNAILQKQRRIKSSKHAWHAPCKVISVGNISSGGSGKTPFCLFLAGLLRDSGLRVGVSHRGYKGSLENTPSLVSDGEKILCSVTEAGDEAYLMASRLKGIPVVVGRQRKEAISLMLASFPELDVVVMDDGFQHLKVARDLDIVCFDAQTGIGNGLLLPAGYLREPMEALSEDTILVINHKAGYSDDDQLESTLSQHSRQIFHFMLQPDVFVDSEGKTFPPASVLGKTSFLISGIANPTSFESTVRSLGIQPLYHFVYPDHYPFTDPSQLGRIAELCRKYKASHLICTEKDLMKLALYKDLKPFLIALRVDLRCQELEPFRKLILKRLDLD